MQTLMPWWRSTSKAELEIAFVAESLTLKRSYTVGSPGLMMQTFTPWWRSTSKAEMEKPSSACLVATYEHCSGFAATAAIDPVLMIAPPWIIGVQRMSARRTVALSGETVDIFSPSGHATKLYSKSHWQTRHVA